VISVPVLGTVSDCTSIRGTASTTHLWYLGPWFVSGVSHLGPYLEHCQVLRSTHCTTHYKVLCMRTSELQECKYLYYWVLVWPKCTRQVGPTTIIVYLLHRKMCFPAVLIMLFSDLKDQIPVPIYVVLSSVCRKNVHRWVIHQVASFGSLPLSKSGRRSLRTCTYYIGSCSRIEVSRWKNNTGGCVMVGRLLKTCFLFMCLYVCITGQKKLV